MTVRITQGMRDEAKAYRRRQAIEAARLAEARRDAARPDSPNNYCVPGYCTVPGHPAWHDEPNQEA